MSGTIRSAASKFRCCGRSSTKHALWRQPQPSQRPTLQHLARNRISFAASCRQFSSNDGDSNKPKNSTTQQEPEDESHLNWKDRKEAPRWMQRIAPTKGGKWPPTPQEAVILASGLAVFVWSWTA